MIWPVKKVYITQLFGANPDIYKRFGYKGHNGYDLRMFDEQGNRASTCLVFAPHDGVIKERHNDIGGYGNYLKIENNIEGSVIAHLKEFKVNINKQVKEGELVAIGNNTGWSTGSHVHWGYYRLPRNRKNGYGGFIDQTPFMGENDINVSIPGWLKQMFLELGIELEKPEREIRGKIQEVIDAYRNKDEVTALRKELKSTNEILADKTLAYSTLQGEIEKQKAKAELAEKNFIEKRDECDKAVWDVKRLEIGIKTLEEDIEKKDEALLTQKEQITQLKLDLAASKAGNLVSLSLWEFIKIKYWR